MWLFATVLNYLFYLNKLIILQYITTLPTDYFTFYKIGSTIFSAFKIPICLLKFSWKLNNPQAIILFHNITKSL